MRKVLVLGSQRGQDWQEQMVWGPTWRDPHFCATGGASPASEADCEGRLLRHGRAPSGQHGGKEKEGTV